LTWLLLSRVSIPASAQEDLLRFARSTRLEIVKSDVATSTRQALVAQFPETFTLDQFVNNMHKTP